MERLNLSIIRKGFWCELVVQEKIFQVMFELNDGP